MLEKNLNPGLKKFAHALMATTCLGVAANKVATAGAITEGTAPAPADFPNTAPGYLLPAGTTQVFGQINSSTDLVDFFEFQDLVPGTSFSVFSSFSPLSQEKSMKFFVFDTSNNQIGAATLEGAGGTVSGSVPNDGDLVVEETFGPRLGPIGSPTYQATLTATEQTTPEPAPLVGTALGLAGLWAWRRRTAAKA